MGNLNKKNKEVLTDAEIIKIIRVLLEMLEYRRRLETEYPNIISTSELDKYKNNINNDDKYTKIKKNNYISYK